METLINLQIKLERNLAEVRRGIQTLELEQVQKINSEKDPK
jgi:hypothetical protein